ncbi:MAG: hypothetical protein R2843_13205, partial [Thermomicrobiales bacterium]
ELDRVASGRSTLDLKVRAAASPPFLLAMVQSSFHLLRTDHRVVGSTRIVRDHRHIHRLLWQEGMHEPVIWAILSERRSALLPAHRVVLKIEQ